MKTYDAHPAALAFPPLKGEELEALKKSILDQGQIFPCVLLDGKILDGRNRQESLSQLIREKKLPASTELKVVPFRGGSIAGFADAANDKRRHLTESQRAMIATKLLPMFRKEAKERQAAAAKSTNRSKKAAQKSLALPAKGRTAKTAAKEAAEASGGKVSSRSVERAEFVLKADPALAKQVFEGTLTVSKAVKKLKRREQDKQVAAYVPPEGKFQVVTADFSWPYDDALDGSDAVRGGTPYPPMSVNAILAFVRGPLARACDAVCLLACWVTNPIMLDLLTWAPVQVEIQKLGFRPVKLNTWRKVEKSGKPFTGLGNGQRNDSEQLVLFARGAVIYNELGEAHGRPLQRTVFDAPIGEHSEKPQLAYDRLEQLVPYTSRLEMFARAERKGWRTSGAELSEEVHAAPPHAVHGLLPVIFGGLSERSDATGEATAWSDAAAFKCSSCGEEFVSREVLSKHAVKHAVADGQQLSVVDAIATGAAVIEISKDREAVLLEVKRLAASRPLEGSVADVKLKGLEKALDDFRLRKRQTKEDRAELAKRDDFADLPAEAKEAAGRIVASPMNLPSVLETAKEVESCAATGKAGAGEPLSPVRAVPLDPKAPLHDPLTGEVVPLGIIETLVMTGLYPIVTPEQHKRGLGEVKRLMNLNPPKGSPVAHRLIAVSTAVEAYEKATFVPPVDPESVTAVPDDGIPF